MKIIQLGNVMPTKTRNNPNHGRVYSADGIAPTLTNLSGGGDRVPMIPIGERIRKLMPIECFRLQGFPDELFHRAEIVNSDSQLYKQAGNSVTVNVIQEIARGFNE